MRCSACGQVMCWSLLLVMVIIVLDSVLLSYPVSFLCVSANAERIEGFGSYAVFLSVCSFVCACGYVCICVRMDNDMPAHSHGAYVKCQLSIVWGVYGVCWDVT